MKILNVNPESVNVGMLWYVEYMIAEENGIKMMQEVFMNKDMAIKRIQKLRKQVKRGKI